MIDPKQLAEDFADHVDAFNGDDDEFVCAMGEAITNVWSAYPERNILQVIGAVEMSMNRLHETLEKVAQAQACDDVNGFAQ